MSTMQRLTLIGIYDYDPTLFDGLTLPDGYDKQTFIDSLLLEHGEKCVLYANPDFMKYSIDMGFQTVHIYDTDKGEEVFVGVMDEMPDTYITAEVCSFDVIDKHSPILTLNVEVDEG